MGARGPIPNASDDLARDRSRKGKDQVAVTKGVRIEPRIWEADPEWSPLAVDLFDSASTSGQMDFYQDTDWVMLKFLCGEITAYVDLAGSGGTNWISVSRRDAAGDRTRQRRQ